MLVRKKLLAPLTVSIAAALAAALLVAGCGGGGSSDSGGGDPASLMPPSAPVFIEANLKPQGSESEALDELAGTIVGIEHVGSYIAEQLEQAALGDEEHLDFEKEIEPWLGEKAGMYLAESEGSNFNTEGAAVETTDTGEAEAFLEKRAEEGAAEPEKAEFEGHTYWVEPEDGTTVGLVGDWLVVAASKDDFEAIVKIAEGGESLADTAKFKTATEAAPGGGLGSVYVDIGALLKESGGDVMSAETRLGLILLGLEPTNSTLVASLTPHPGQVEIDLATNLTTTPQGGDASALLESLPATAVGAIASSEFGKTFGESIHGIDEEGIPGEIPPGKFEEAFESFGISFRSIAASIGEVGAFVEGSSEANLGGAAVLTTKDPNEALDTITKVGLLLRTSQTPGVTALNGKMTGFSVRSPSLGRQPLIFGAAGEKVVIAYGARAAAQALREQAKTLGSTADFEAAKEALGSVPIGAFVEGRPGLKLAEALLSPEERAELTAARPYLQKIAYIGAGSEAKGDSTVAKIILGVQK